MRGGKSLGIINILQKDQKVDLQIIKELTLVNFENGTSVVYLVGNNPSELYKYKD